MKTRTFFSILLTFVALISLPTLAMHDKMHEKKGKNKLAKLVTCSKLICIGDLEINEEQERKNPLSPKGPNLNKEFNTKKPSSIGKKERLERKGLQKSNLQKSKRHSLSDDIENIDEVKEEINKAAQEFLEQEEKEYEALKREAREEIYGSKSLDENRTYYAQEENGGSGEDGEDSE